MVTGYHDGVGASAKPDVLVTTIENHGKYSLPREERRNMSKLYNKMPLNGLKKLAPQGATTTRDSGSSAGQDLIQDAGALTPKADMSQDRHPEAADTRLREEPSRTSSQTSPAVHTQIDWDRYFNSLLVDKVTPDEPIIVVVPKFVQQFESLILRTPARTVANYMVWWVVLQSYATLGKPWRERLQEFGSVLTGETREMARWEQCMGSLTGYLGIALSSLYVRHFFQEESKGAALDMVNFIMKEFMSILEDINWMDEQTRQRARAKALAIQPYIGYPEELLKDALVEEHYSNVTLQPDTYFENVMRLRKWYTDYGYGHLRKPHIKGEWKRFAQVAVVDAYYSDVENCIRLPAGILQGVFFSKDRPSYLNYGAIGSIIGHEITHGFDDEGRQFDKDGNNLNWWEPETDLKFRQRAQCIVEQYGNYTVAEGTLNANVGPTLVCCLGILFNLLWSLTVAWAWVVLVEAAQPHLPKGATAVDVVGFPAVVPQRASIGRPPHVGLPRRRLLRADQLNLSFLASRILRHRRVSSGWCRDLAYSLPREERRNMSKLYNKMPLNGLKKLAPQIDWDRYFNSLLVDKVTPDEPIIVVVPKFVQQFESLILRTPARTVANYMVWWVVLQSYATLGKPWRERLQEFGSVLTGETREMARWEQCMGSLTGYLGIALSSLYVRHFFQEESKGAALDMVNFIMKEFMSILEDINWMDEQTRQRARAKALAIQPYIGYPEELLKDALVEEHYSNVTLQPDTYFQNVMRLRKWYTDYGYGHLRKPHIKGEWKRFAQVAVVDAYYSDVENCIRLPAGILQGVFFSKDRPSYLNYGAIGSIIGHEITHGFDDEGRQFDKDGNNLNWWEPETDLKFRQRAQCIVEQYGNYTVAEGTLNINGVNTQGENIADNGGIKEAFNNMNQTVDPCENFYEFACGGWVHRHPIPEDRSSVSQLSFIRDQLDAKLRTLVEEPPENSEPGFIHKMKHMYRSCFNTSLIDSYAEEPLQKVLKVLGGWPVVEGPGWNASKFHWLNALIQYRNFGYSHNILLDLHVTLDPRNNTRYIIVLDEASLGLPDRTYFLKGLNDSVVAAYLKLMTEAAQLLGANQKAAETELREALQFEIALANYSLPREERRNMSKLYNKMPLNGLKKLAPQIDWDRYFNSLLVDKVTPDEPIIVVVPKFVQQFESLILRTPARTVANYMVWWVVLQSYATLGKPWRERLQEFGSVLTGETREMARWEQCMGSLTGYLGIALSSLYVRHFFQEESKGAALDMVNFIMKEFMSILEDINWMDEQTRQRARAKALAIQPYIGYPEELLKDALVEEHYSNVTLQPDTYFQNVMRLRKWYTDYGYGHLRKPHIKGEWKRFAQVAVVDAYYSDVENCIRLPAGILQGVFFSKDRPSYLNYGAIGSIIGHEITHGFDDEGRQFDKDGNNLNWWEPETDLKFRQRAQCIVEQYGNYTVAEGTLNINGVNTQGENIADNGGIKEAFNILSTVCAFESFGNL
ncbi:neprilysin-2-like [Ixodes scapularis]